MRRKALTLALILAILLSVTIGKQVAKLGIANPWTEFRWTEPPVISMQSPTNETNSRSILLNFTVTKPEGWKSNPTMFRHTHSLRRGTTI
jgi:hypothetical protein